MSRRGRHRGQRSSRLTRISLMVTAGGAGIALPLTAVGAAAAAPGGLQPSTYAEQAAQATEQAAASASQAAADEERGVYTVVSGDTLRSIADSEDVDGGWQALYEANREVIGDDPDLIKPGQELALEGEADGADATADDGEPADGTAERTALAAAEAEPEPEPETGAGAGFTAPVDAAASTAYGVAGALWGSGYHTGVDFSAASGTTVSAVGAGTVVTAGWDGSYGNQVVIEHADGHYSQYAHLSSLSVSSGQQVGTGDEIGLVGSTGNSTGPHLHFEVRTGPDYGSDIDPLGYLRGQGVTI